MVWSTQRAWAGGYGQEANPFCGRREFECDLISDTGEPLVMDFLGSR